MLDPREALRRSPGRCALVLCLVPAAAGAAWGILDRILDQLGMKAKT